MKGEISQELIVSAINNATIEVFSTMLSLEIRQGDPYVDRNAPGPSDGVVGLIGLAGTWVGTGSFACSAEMACKISAHLLMTEYQAVNEEVLDAVAEVTNMVIGNVKTAIEEHLGPMGLSIPTVVFGRNFTTRSMGSSEWTVVPFYHDADSRIEVQVCLAENREAGTPSRYLVGARSSS
ncbi:MAG: chemotaxis protein CheX [Bryobacteraceae bacterium]